MRRSARATPLLSPFGAAAAGLGAAPGFPAALVELVRGGGLDETGAFLAFELARLARGLARPEREKLAGLCGRLLVAQATGGTRVRVTDEERALLAGVPELVEVTRAAARAPLVLDGEHLYTQRAHACERRVAARLGERLAAGPFPAAALDRAVAAAAAARRPAPTAEQQAAVRAALGRRLGVISGGPGTGKTTTALLLVRALDRLGVPLAAIALAAPTGKAKSRLEEGFRAELGADAPEAQTLHRLLGATAGPGGLARAGAAPLPYRAVIVDECSMVDLVLMDRLLRALPADCQLVLLGDADQLPSVSAGAVFRDLGALAVRLERGFRAVPEHPGGAELAELARAVRAGSSETALALCVPRGGPGALRREGAEHLAAAHREPLLREEHRRFLAAPALGELAERTLLLDGDGFAAEEAALLDAVAAAHARARVLGVTRKGPAGVERVNRLWHELTGGGLSLRAGEPVLMLRNDYQRELWNGDPGIAVRARRPGHAPIVVCAFRARRGWLAVEPAAVGGGLDLGYALTVHKAQGSEYDEVLLLLPERECPLVTRELLYTAVSRARGSVMLCGELAILAQGLAARAERASGLAERLDTLARVR